MESVREVEHCLELTIAPVNLADYDKLVSLYSLCSKSLACCMIYFTGES